jgi:hypothetical protein
VFGPLSLGYGRSGESPWLWLVIVGGGIALYVLGRIGGWQRPRRWSDVGDALLLAGSPWWLQAPLLAIIGGASVYHLSSGHYRWFWWLVPAAAWLTCAGVVLRRKRSGGD